MRPSAPIVHSSEPGMRTDLPFSALVPVKVQVLDDVVCHDEVVHEDLDIRKAATNDSGSGTPVWMQGNLVAGLDESRRQGGQAPDQANGGRQAGVAVHTRTIHSQETQTRPDA
jgi:hypothetical protein